MGNKHVDQRDFDRFKELIEETQERLDNLFSDDDREDCKEILKLFTDNMDKWKGKDKKFEQLYDLFYLYYNKKVKPNKPIPEIMPESMKKELFDLAEKYCKEN